MRAFVSFGLLAEARSACLEGVLTPGSLGY